MDRHSTRQSNHSAHLLGREILQRNICLEPITCREIRKITDVRYSLMAGMVVRREGGNSSRERQTDK